MNDNEANATVYLVDDDASVRWETTWTKSSTSQSGVRNRTASRDRDGWTDTSCLQMCDRSRACPVTLGRA